MRFLKVACSLLLAALPVFANLPGGGNGTGAVTVNAGGTLAPGMSGIGTLTFSNALTLTAGSTNIFAIAKLPLTNDIAKIFGNLTNGGTLLVTNIGTTELTNGDSFQLFNAGGYNGTFANIILPPLSSGLVWNTNALNTNGTVSVVALTSPAITAIQRAGGNLDIRGSGGTANWLYVVLTATNLTAPWMPMATNHFDATGGFSLSLTNIGNSSRPRSFYRLQLQRHGLVYS
jgi:hypothetical protein